MIKYPSIRIVGVQGIYFRDNSRIFRGFKEIDIATIQKSLEKDTRFEYVIRVRFFDKEKKISMFFSDKTARAALVLAESEKIRLYEELRDGKYIVGKVPSLNKLFEEYIGSRSESVRPLNPRTLQNYKDFYYKWIRPAIGKMSIDKIEYRSIQPIVKQLHQAGLSPRTQQSVKQTLSPIFKHAIRLGYRQTNPVSLVETQPVRNVKSFMLNEADAKKIYKTICQWQDPAIRAFLLFVFTGRRIHSEAARIKWEDIDFANKCYTLTGIENTKNKDDRLFPLIPPLIKALKQMKPKDEGYIFAENKPLAKGTGRHRWDALVRVSGVEMGAHECRNLIGHVLKTADRLSDDLIGYLFGHSRHSVSVTGRYAFAGYRLVEELTLRYIELIEKGGWENYLPDS